MKYSLNVKTKKKKLCNFQLIGTKNKGTVTRSTDFGRTPVSDIFRGELRSRLQREGDHSTDVMQPFFTLQLNIEVSFSCTFFFCFHTKLLNNVSNIFLTTIKCLSPFSSQMAESEFSERGIREFRK